MSSRRSRWPAVYIGLVPIGWLPESPWTFPPGFRNMELHHRAAFSAAREFVQDFNVRQLRLSAAGTDAVLDDVDRFLEMADAADRWTAEAGEDLFPIGDLPTLTTFYRDVFLPMRDAVISRGCRLQYDITVKIWRLLTADPPLGEITPVLLTRFRDALMRRGNQRGFPLSPRTVKNKLVMVGSILKLAGPAGPRHRDSVEIIPRVPWVRPPKVIPKPPVVIPPEVLSDLYLATVGMEQPRVPGVKPPKWWKALLVTAYNTGLRKTSLLTLRMADIDWQRAVIVIPGERMKSGRPHAVPLNATTLAHVWCNAT